MTGRQNPQASGNMIVVDAFDIQPNFTVSHWQDTNPDFQYTGGWIKSSENFPWSGNGVSNLPERPVTAHETSAAGEKVTVVARIRNKLGATSRAQIAAWTARQGLLGETSST